MAVRILILICFCAATAGCKNEPYETVPLGVVSIVNSATTQSWTYTYREKKLKTFMSRLKGDTLASMTFHFQSDQIKFITLDSSSKSYTKTYFYAFADNIVDSTFYVDADTTMLMSTRTVFYDGAGNPTSVRSTTAATDSLAELTWNDGNVTHLTVSDMSTGEKIPVTDIAISYDEEFSIYMKNDQYLYTFPLDELYWLSKNNAIDFTDANGSSSNMYWFNKFGYPSNYENVRGVTYGMTYTQVR